MGNFSTAPIFSDGCVLQRNKECCIFGSADDGQTVSVRIIRNGNVLDENSTRARNGRWITYLGAMDAQENLVLEIRCCGESKTFTDVSVGEVWLAGGQSNMEFELQNCTEGPEALRLDKEPNVRFYYTPKNSWMDEKFFEDERKSAWQTWDSEQKGTWSAVGYFFARKLAADLGVTVGIIGCNWGGTSAAAWMGRERLEKNSDLKIYLDEQEEETSGKSVETQCREYDEYVAYHERWSKKCDELYRKNPSIEWSEVQEIIGPCRWPGPKSCKNPYRPTGLHDCMIKRIAPYTLKGFLFYQGESDDHRPESYYTLFREMIDQWRSDWNDMLPMVFVQLPEHRYHRDEDFRNWCLIREAQEKAFRTIAKTGMTVAADLGQYDDIHPRAKKTLGERMERTALHTAYGMLDEKSVNGPLFRNAVPRDGLIELHFDFAEDGFTVKDDVQGLENYRHMEKIHGHKLPDDFTGFEVAGSDGVFHPAEYIFGNMPGNRGTIILKSEKVPEPVYARYAWYNYGPVSIFGKNGIPLAPFRTYSYINGEKSSGHAEIQQIMET